MVLETNDEGEEHWTPIELDEHPALVAAYDARLGRPEGEPDMEYADASEDELEVPAFADRYLAHYRALWR